MRGQHSLFNNLIEPAHFKAPTLKRGRNTELMQKRNHLLMHRYYFYVKIKRKQYQDTLDVLEKEFQLSQLRIVMCMNQNSKTLKEIFNSKPDVKFLKESFDWFVWN